MYKKRDTMVKVITWIILLSMVGTIVAALFV
jgi:hypothetical protein